MESDFSIDGLKLKDAFSVPVILCDKAKVSCCVHATVASTEKRKTLQPVASRNENIMDLRGIPTLIKAIISADFLACLLMKLLFTQSVSTLSTERTK